jgi:hypothetical protein
MTEETYVVLVDKCSSDVLPERKTGRSMDRDVNGMYSLCFTRELLYNNLIEFEMPTKVIRPNKIYLKETSYKVERDNI